MMFVSPLLIVYPMRRLFAAALLATTFIAHCEAASWHDDLPNATMIGNGELTWFGLKIYHATLWSENKPFDPERSFALELTYQRSIKREQFVDVSIAEIRRLFGDRYGPNTLKRWEAELSQAFVDVDAGDQLTGVYLPGKGCRFYGRKDLISTIQDPELASTFFAIWLDERTKESGLRKQLLGGTK